MNLNDATTGRIKSLPFLPRVTKYTDPVRFSQKDEHLRPLFAEIMSHNCSDIYISEGKPIVVLVKQKMFAITRSIDKSESQFILQEIAGQTALSSVFSKRAVNTTFSLYDNDETKVNFNNHRLQNNFRVNVSAIRYQGETAFQIVLRTIPTDPPRFYEIGMSEDFVKMLCPAKGMVIIGGATGHGKSTTLASGVVYILEEDTPIKGNIITHEEPIEFVYENIRSEHSIIVQSQIPECFETFEDANREAMRRKPALILIGELRDKSTIESAVEASLTGHPTFATVHAGSVVEVVRRMLSKFEPNEKSTALYNILSTTHLFVAQRLIKDVNGDLFAVREWLLMTDEIREQVLNISDPIEMYQKINEYMKTASEKVVDYASPTFSVQGDRLFEQGKIDQGSLRYLKITG